jgi:Xaa-Pro dipeptidase
MLPMNLALAREKMKERGLDGILATTESNFYYTTGFRVPLGGKPAISIIPADLGSEPAMLVASFNQKVAEQGSCPRDIRSYPTWIETVDVQDIIEGKVKRSEKPFQFDLGDVYRRLADILREKGLWEGTVGIERESYTPQAHFFLAKHNPKTRFVDAESLFWKLRSIKTPEEIDILKSAAQITEMGIRAMTRDRIEGATIGELHYRYKMGIMEGINGENASSFESSWATITAGDIFQSINHPGHRISKGESIHCDVGISLEGYFSDIARTFVVGKPDDLRRRIFRALKAGHDAALERIGPGVKMREIFELALGTVRRSGLDWYSRGHMGHTIGLGPRGEQPPFISATEEGVFEPNMVICLEAPLYVGGLGGFQIEEEILITKDGYEFLITLPREMMEI